MSPRKLLARDVRAVVVTLVGTVLLATAIDPYLSLSGSPPLAIAINAAIPVLVALAALAVGGRWPLAWVAAAGTAAVLCVADHFKMQVLYNNLLFADLALLPELAQQPGLVLGFVRPDARGWALLALGCALAGVVVMLALRRPPAGCRVRAVAALACIGGGIALAQARISHEVPSIGWLLPMQISGATQAGVAGNVLLGHLSTHRAKPRASAEAVAAFWADPLVQATRTRLAARKSGNRPDIVFVQSESLFEPALLCAVGDAPVLRTLAALPGDGVQNLRVPVFGHRTLQTEFEVLTGFPVDFAPQSRFAYYELVDGPIAALPRQLRALGYRTIAVHPNRRSFWRRDQAYPAMGFDAFIDGSAYFRASDYSRIGWVGEGALTRTILSQLDDDSPVPTMVFAVSIENHGPWGGGEVPAVPDVAVAPSLQGPARAQLLDYIDRARRADDNLADLLRALAQRQRPTLVVFYGDHLPALGDVYAQTCFKDGKAPTAHSPPLRLWSNFALDAPLDGETYSHLLAARVLHAAGLPLEGVFLAGAVADQLQRDAEVDATARRRILDRYAHVAAQAVLATPVAADRAMAFIGSAHANDALFGMQSEVKLARGDDGTYRRGTPWPAGVGEVTLRLDRRVASAVIRPWAGWDAACEAKPITLDTVADGKLVARAHLDPHAVPIHALPLAGVDTLRLRVEDRAAVAECAQFGVEVNQVLCYAPGCDVPGPGAAPAKPAEATGGRAGEAMRAVLE